MTKAELEELAIGMETGYTDRAGVPICIGDEVVYYKKCTEFVGEDAKEYPDEWRVGTGGQGYVYSGKIIRTRHKVTFTADDGIRILEGQKYKYLYEKDPDGNLLTILVDNMRCNPKLTFEQVIGKEGSDVK